jgi:membrane protease subunit HflK
MHDLFHDHSHHDEHAHRNLETIEEPLDTANEALSDALKVSFRVLKGIMLVLVVCFLFSNISRVGASEQLLILRFGDLKDEVHEAGLVAALPFPIDEVLRLPVFASNTLQVDKNMFHRRPEEASLAVSAIIRSEMLGLDPTLDGALLTADAGLVHTEWVIVWRIDDVRDYVSNLYGAEGTEAAEALLSTLMEDIAIKVASELTAEELIRTRLEYVQSEVTRRLNLELASLECGIEVSSVEMENPVPPPQIRRAFDSTQRAENTKWQRIRQAEQERVRLLSDASGSSYNELVDLLDAVDQAKAEGDAAREAELEAALEEMLTTRVEGKAGKMIQDAGAYYSVVVRRMQGDIELYQTLLPEYQRNPELLLERLCQAVFEDVLTAEGVKKVYVPEGAMEVRLLIQPDPDEKRAEEQRRLQSREFDPGSLIPDIRVPVGPEYD